jgi:hypothetical protein
MMSARQFTTIGCLIALLGVSGCAWERGGHGRDRDDNRRDQHGQVPNTYQRDRDGRPCSGPGEQGGDERHNQDCRPNGH